MSKLILRGANRVARSFGYELKKKSVTTARRNLDLFSYAGSEREWQQLAMYCSVMNQIAPIPGDIAEFGVAGGTSFCALARLVKVFDPYRTDEIARRMLFGFDTFEGLPFFDEGKDTGINVPKEMKLGGYNASADFDSLTARLEPYDNVKLYKGTFDQSLPLFFEENKHVTFSLIHIDCDLHQSTVDALRPTMKRLNVGGVILFDEVFNSSFPGETTGFIEVYEELRDNYSLEFVRVKSMPWKWYAIRRA